MWWPAIRRLSISDISFLSPNLEKPFPLPFNFPLYTAYVQTMERKGIYDCFPISQVRNAMFGGKRKPSFKMVSNMVIQLLHSIKYSVEVPFSNMTQQPVEIQKNTVTKKVRRRRGTSCLTTRKQDERKQYEINVERKRQLEGSLSPLHPQNTT